MKMWFYLEIGSEPGGNTSDVDIGIGCRIAKLKNSDVIYKKCELEQH
jgi:hypothetical protein